MLRKRKLGRPSMLTDEQCIEALELNRDYTHKSIAEHFDVSVSTIERAIKRAKQIKRD